jgi:hypothetical protein
VRAKEGRALNGPAFSLSGLLSLNIKASILDTWDAAIVERFDRIRAGAAGERAPYALRVSASCLESLDRTLDELRHRARRRGDEAVSNGAELADLRSAAIELAVGGYVDGLRRRRRPGPTVTPLRAGSERRPSLETVVCHLPHDLIDGLDGLLLESLDGRPAGVREAELAEARDVVVESTITSWLMLRGYSTMVPAESRAGGWLAAVKWLAGRRTRR